MFCSPSALDGVCSHARAAVYRGAQPAPSPVNPKSWAQWLLGFLPNCGRARFSKPLYGLNAARLQRATRVTVAMLVASAFSFATPLSARYPLAPWAAVSWSTACVHRAVDVELVSL